MPNGQAEMNPDGNYILNHHGLAGSCGVCILGFETKLLPWWVSEVILWGREEFFLISKMITY